MLFNVTLGGWFLILVAVMVFTVAFDVLAWLLVCGVCGFIAGLFC